MNKGRIYIVHYGENIDITCKFIESIYPFLNESRELIIINNSKEIDIDNLSDNFIHIINTDRNLGYFGGIKFGIEKFPIDTLDYIIISNNDIQILNPDFFSTLEKKLNSYDIIAPSIKTHENIEQNPHRQSHLSKIRKLYYKIYFSNYFNAFCLTKIIAFKKNLLKNKFQTQEEREIFSPHGAFIILSKSYFEKGGYIEDGYFLYGEEDSIAAIAEENKMKIGFVPHLRILHSESINTGKILTRAKYNYQKYANKYISRKYARLFDLC